MAAPDDALTPKGRLAREAIMAAGTELFAQNGINGASISEIAAAAGVNRAMIAYYFGSKAGLYDAIIDAAVADVAGALGEIDIAPNGPAPERRLVYAFAEMMQKRPHLSRMIIHEYFRPGRLFEPEAAGKLAGMMGLTGRVLDSIQLGPRARTYDVQVVHLICVGALIWFTFTEPFRSRLAGRLDKPLTQPTVDEFAETLADMLTAGLRS